ncbi:hypothetical protein DFH08DRAFT_801883 [Mycena albidolilacea]|uniref:Uncharacterized protein n=1 Tax=Mycena albidolilacea TaxID=1033008 RepID=A0AAD7AGP0_9AGAR|nr:hypothetical protein DFH08DRAFT_801883 [Mycena albidolilacea]
MRRTLKYGYWSQWRETKTCATLQEKWAGVRTKDRAYLAKETAPGVEVVVVDLDDEDYRGDKGDEEEGLPDYEDEGDNEVIDSLIDSFNGTTVKNGRCRACQGKGGYLMQKGAPSTDAMHYRIAAADNALLLLSLVVYTPSRLHRPTSAPSCSVHPATSAPLHAITLPSSAPEVVEVLGKAGAKHRKSTALTMREEDVNTKSCTRCKGGYSRIGPDHQKPVQGCWKRWGKRQCGGSKYRN